MSRASELPREMNFMTGFHAGLRRLEGRPYAETNDGLHYSSWIKQRLWELRPSLNLLRVSPAHWVQGSVPLEQRFKHGPQVQIGNFCRSANGERE